MTAILTITHFLIAIVGFAYGKHHATMKLMDTDFHLEFVAKVYKEEIEKQIKEEIDKWKERNLK